MMMNLSFPLGLEHTVLVWLSDEFDGQLELVRPNPLKCPQELLGTVEQPPKRSYKNPEIYKLPCIRAMVSY